MLKAIAQFDNLKRDRFLERYGFDKATRYFIEHEGEEYDCKPIIWAAHQFQFGREPASRGTSGVNKFIRPALERIGFTVIDKG